MGPNPTLSIAVAAMLSFASLVSAQQNLLPDPDFAKTRTVMEKEGEQARRHGPNTPWKWHVIEAEANVTYNDGFVEASGGKVFLHSAEFDVEPGKRYDVSFTATGDGKVSAGFLWWNRGKNEARTMAEPHWTRMDEPAEAGSDEPAKISATFEAPGDADTTYLRLVVTDGTATLRNLQVRFASE